MWQRSPVPAAGGPGGRGEEGVVRLLLFTLLVAPGCPTVCPWKHGPTGRLVDLANANRSEVSVSRAGDLGRALGGTEKEAG